MMPRKLKVQTMKKTAPQIGTLFFIGQNASFQTKPVVLE